MTKKADLPAVREAAKVYLTETEITTKQKTRKLTADDSLSEEDLVPIYPELMNLDDSKKRSLIAVVRNVLSDDKQTDTQLAAELGINRRTLYLHRQNRAFGLALTVILGDIVRGTSDKAIMCLFKLAERDTAAVKVWLNMAELWIDKRQQQNVNVNLSRAGQKMNFQETVDDVLTLIGTSGWNEERLVARFRQLKDEGAF